MSGGPFAPMQRPRPYDRIETGYDFFKPPGFKRKPTTMQEYTVVLTDTLCGEKNYGWVYRTTVRARSVRGALRAARKHWFLPGTRGRYNVQLGEWTPFGSHTVIYIEGEF